MRSVILLSGGIDSSVLLAWLRNKTTSTYIWAVTVDYGQRHKRELWSAFQIARYYGASDVRLNLPVRLLCGSSLTGSNGDYEGTPTIVPGRNLVLASLAISEAVRNKCEAVYLAPNLTDRPVYPDCRPEFINGLNESSISGYGVRVETPFIDKTKEEIVEIGRELRVPFEMTWSCYNPVEYSDSAPASGRPCGFCGACVIRKGVLKK